VIATTQQLKVPVVAVDTAPVVAVDLKSATSAPRLVTLPVTALRLAAMAEVDMAVNRAAMVVDSAAVEAEVEDKPATLVVAMAICLATALRARSATTVVRLATCLETAPPRPAANVLATNASNPDTFRRNARTRTSLLR